MSAKLFDVEKLSYYPPTKGYAIRLKQIDGLIEFSIIVGADEAQAIALALEGVQPPRPFTHDIIIDILTSSDVRLDKVEIYKFSDGVFYSRLYIKNIHIGIKMIDCRPSDAIAIAVRCSSLISISDSILSKIKANEVISDFTFNSIEEYNNNDSLSPLVIINKLNKALNNAVENENYEVAAKLRDKIKVMKESD